jgi:hypothetical protein
MKLDTSGLESFSAAVPSAVNGGAQLGGDQLFDPASFELPAGCADVFPSSNLCSLHSIIYNLSCLSSFLLVSSFFSLTYWEVPYMPKDPPPNTPLNLVFACEPPSKSTIYAVIFSIDRAVTLIISILKVHLQYNTFKGRSTCVMCN